MNIPLPIVIFQCFFYHSIIIIFPLLKNRRLKIEFFFWDGDFQFFAEMGYLFCATGADIAVIISLIFCENEEIVFAGRQH